jgi:hypothetical protein
MSLKRFSFQLPFYACTKIIFDLVCFIGFGLFICPPSGLILKRFSQLVCPLASLFLSLPQVGKFIFTCLFEIEIAVIR